MLILGGRRREPTRSPQWAEGSAQEKKKIESENK
jgi:hypothetical protein